MRPISSTQQPLTSDKTNAKSQPSLVKNGMSNWIPLGANIIFGFVLTPYLIKSLGKADYGIWLLVAYLLGYYGLLRLGVGSGIMRYVPLNAGRNDGRTSSEIVSTALAIFLCIGLIIFAVSMLLAAPIARFYNGGQQLELLLRIMGLAAAIECPMRIFDASIRAHERWVAANYVTTVMAIARAGGLAGCVFLGYGVIEMGWVILGVSIFSVILMVAMFARYCPDTHLIVSGVKLKHFKSLVIFGVLSTVVTAVSALRMQGHTLIIGKMLSVEMITLYGVAIHIIRQVRHVVLAPTRVLWPRFAYLDGGNNQKQISELFQTGTKFAAAFSSLMVLVVFVAGPAFIRLWVGEGFEAVYPALMLLGVGYLVELSLTITGTLLAGTGRQGIHAVMTFAEGLIGTILGIVLTWQTNLGLAAVALGFVVSIIIVRGTVIPFYICHLYSINISRYYIDCLLRPWFILLGLVIAAKYLGVADLIVSWASLVLVVCALGTVYLISVYTIGIDRQMRRTINALVCSMIQRLADKFRRLKFQTENDPDNGFKEMPEKISYNKVNTLMPEVERGSYS